MKNNDIKKLHYTFTWDQHFFPQVKWINDVDLKNLIIIKYQKDLNQSIQSLLKYLEIDNKELILSKINSETHNSHLNTALNENRKKIKKFRLS